VGAHIKMAIQRAAKLQGGPMYPIVFDTALVADLHARVERIEGKSVVVAPSKALVPRSPATGGATSSAAAAAASGSPQHNVRVPNGCCLNCVRGHRLSPDDPSVKHALKDCTRDCMLKCPNPGCGGVHWASECPLKANT